MPDDAVVTAKGARRWRHGHPWIFRSDLTRRPSTPAGAVLVRGPDQQPLGWGLWSPPSEISLRLLDSNPDATIDGRWWHERIGRAAARRALLAAATNAYRLVHAEGDGCPSLICDRYDSFLVVQLLSAGVERFRDEIVQALRSLGTPEGILARNDAPVR